jgi:hypothetical protein
MRLLLANEDEVEEAQEEIAALMDVLNTEGYTTTTRAIQAIEFRINWLKMAIHLYEWQLDHSETPYLPMDVLELFEDVYNVVYSLTQDMDRLIRENMQQEYYHDRIACDEIRDLDIGQDDAGRWVVHGVTIRGESVSYDGSSPDTNSRFLSFEKMSDPEWLPKMVAEQRARLDQANKRKIAQEEANRKQREATERKLYEQLKSKFETDAGNGT